MVDKLTYLETKTDKYPLAFTFNVLEAIQGEYGSFNKWAEMMSEEEPNLKALKFGITEAINEGIDIENERLESKRNFLTPKQVGRIITEIGLKEASKAVRGSLTSGEQEEKN